MKVVIAILAALCWLGGLMAGAAYALDGLDRSVAGLPGMLMLLLLTLAAALTGIWLRMLAAQHPRLGHFAWVFFAFVFLLWTNFQLALASLLLVPLAGVWLLVQWFRKKPDAGDTPPAP